MTKPVFHPNVFAADVFPPGLGLTAAEGAIKKLKIKVSFTIFF